MKRLLVVVLVTAFLGGLFLFGLLRGAPDRNIESNRLGREMPSFELPVHAPLLAQFGPTFEFSPEALDKPIVVNFWATWCAPCREEAPVLQYAWQEYGDEVTVLGIQTQDRDNQREGVAFMNEFGLTFPNVIDNSSRVSIDWGLFGVPETYFIRGDGTLVYKHVGIVTNELMDQRIAELLES